LENVSVYSGGASVYCSHLLKTESIKSCQQQFLEKFGGRHPPSLVEETGNQGDFIGRAYRRSSKNVRGNDPKCEGPTTGVSQEVTVPTFTGIRVVQKHLSTCCEKSEVSCIPYLRGPRIKKSLTK